VRPGVIIKDVRFRSHDCHSLSSQPCNIRRHTLAPQPEKPVKRSHSQTRFQRQLQSLTRRFDLSGNLPEWLRRKPGGIDPSNAGGHAVLKSVGDRIQIALQAVNAAKALAVEDDVLLV
jgi:hypothetical protein